MLFSSNKKILEKYYFNNRSCFILFVLFFSFVIILLNWKTDNLLYSSYRTEQLESLVSIIARGEVPEFLNQKIHSYGWSFYLPYIAYFFGVDNIDNLLFALHMFASWFLLILFPIEICYLTHNYSISFFSVVLLHLFCGNILYGFKTQTFWPSAWIIIVSMPLAYLFLFCNIEEAKRIKVLFYIGIMCSCANVLRNQNSFSILVLMFILILIVNIRKIKNCLFYYIIRDFLIESTLFFISYNLISVYIPLLFGIILNQDILNNGGFVWHSFLCGLGFFDNPYGLKWDDMTIINLLGYTDYSNQYLTDCKLFLFNLIVNDPKFVFSTWIKKFFFCLSRSASFVFWNTDDAAQYAYYNNGILCTANILFQSIIGLTFCCYAMFKSKSFYKKINIKKLSFIVFSTLLIIVLGTIQGVIGNCYSVTYYMPTLTAMCALPLFLIIFFLNQMFNTDDNNR